MIRFCARCGLLAMVFGSIGLTNSANATGGYYQSFIVVQESGRLRTIWGSNTFNLIALDYSHQGNDLWIQGKVENGTWGQCEEETPNIWNQDMPASVHCNTSPQYSNDCSKFFGSIDGTSDAVLQNNANEPVWSPLVQQLQGSVSDCSTPLLLDLDRNNFHLAPGPVEFDIDGDGVLDAIGWTASWQRDAFVALDRSGNNRIDDGTELFGSATRLVDGTRATNGYEALAEYDLIESGGNADGVLTEEDAIFASLLVWVDANQDGVSQADEIQTMSAAGVIELGLDSFPLPKKDRYGNEFFLNGVAWILVGGDVKRTWTTDVIFTFVE